jgi:hypothetical protein
MYNMYTDDGQGPSNQNEKAWLEIRDNTVALVAYYTTDVKKKNSQEKFPLFTAEFVSPPSCTNEFLTVAGIEQCKGAMASFK